MTVNEKKEDWVSFLKHKHKNVFPELDAACREQGGIERQAAGYLQGRGLFQAIFISIVRDHFVIPVYREYFC